MKILASYVLLLTSTFCSGLSLAQNQTSVATTTAASQSSDTLPAEIIVTPLMNRRNLRSLISQVEEDFVKRFNELNLDEDYDIDCYKYTKTGTHMTKAICEPNFFKDARREDASLAVFNMASATTLFRLEAVQVLTDNGLRRGLGQEYAIMQAKVAKLTNSDQALKTLIENLNELNHSLESYGKDD